MGKRRG
ncbi:unnamed protein product, partial [Rotaria sp. Silwood2]